MRILRSVCRIRHLSSAKRDFTLGKIVYNSQPGVTSPKQPKQVTDDVSGLSSSVLKVPDCPVGPGASKESNYKNPEYFCYDKTSYFEAETEMLKYRCPQPSNKEHYTQ